MQGWTLSVADLAAWALGHPAGASLSHLIPAVTVPG